MRLSTPVVQATFCLALALPTLTTQTTAQSFPQAPAAAQQSWLGVAIVDIAPGRAQALGIEAGFGVEVASVAPNGPAEQAGIQSGDIIVRFAGQPVLSTEHVARLVQQTPPERSVALDCWREGTSLSINVVIQQRGGTKSMDRDQWPQQQSRGLGFDVSRPVGVIHNRTLGVEIEPLKGQFAEFFGVESGVLVRAVDEHSPAAAAGVLAGDVIVAIGAGVVSYPRDLRREMLRAASPIKLSIVRSKRKRSLTLPEGEDSDKGWPLSRHPEAR